jgi:uncharacterized membrane protein YdbT with pleckstrin-like domain
VSYVRHVLQKDEVVRFATTVHWLVYLRGLVVLALAILGWIFYSAAAPGPLQSLLYVVTVALLAAAVVLLFVAWFQRWTTEIAVTNRRIIYKRGFISRLTFEINLDKVESVDVIQSILGRLFDYGDIVIMGVGEGKQWLHKVGAPIELRNHVTAEPSTPAPRPIQPPQH